MTIQPTLETNSLKLRLFVPSDATDVQFMAGDYRVAKMTENIPHPYLEGMAEEWISTHEKRWHARECATWAICTNTDEKLIGSIGLTLNGKHYRASLGYWVDRVHWDKGFCTEAAKAVVDFGFKQLNLHRIEATHLTINPASGAVMRKVGMKHEGTMHDYVLKDGIFEDMEQYAILAK
ncbi:GNAT family N-acetyltransferase [bacterium]|nr:GNAT family N-acetyltransferase [bacterium]